jgi:hypothetical protein
MVAHTGFITVARAASPPPAVSSEAEASDAN